MSPTTVHIRGVSKSYPPQAGVARTTAVDDVTLSIVAGDLYFLLGPSGCGKTTLLRMIAGFIEPTAGTICFATGESERDVTHLAPEKRETGMVFQSYALWPHMTVEQNVAFGLEVRKVPRAERRRRAFEALEQVRMGEYASRRPTQLSGGQQQRVALARALVVRPSVLLLDEPLSNLDAKLRLELRGEIRRVCKESGLTTVYVTHDQKEALSMADQVAVMLAGRVVQVGPPRTLYQSPASRFVAEFLGETNILEARVRESGPRGTLLETPVGVLRSTHPAGTGLPPGTACLVSIRPEAIAILSSPTAAGAATNELAANLIDLTYLGDFTQMRFRVAGNMLRVCMVNVGVPTIAGGVLRIAVGEADVVVIGEHQAGDGVRVGASVGADGMVAPRPNGLPADDLSRRRP